MKAIELDFHVVLLVSRYFTKKEIDELFLEVN